MYVIFTGRIDESVPRSKRLLTDEQSNVLVYMTGERERERERYIYIRDNISAGHGGDGFLKFQDNEEISSVELADAFQQMWQKKRFSLPSLLILFMSLD